MSNIMDIKTDEIFIVGNRRPLNQDAVARLADSISNIGLQTPITVRLTDVLDPEDGEYTRAFVLITGRHRLEAYKVLGLDRIPAIIRNCDEIEAQLWEIAENLHRAELTALERDEQVAKWIELSANKLSQPETVSKGGRGNEGGVNAAARDLNISKPDAHRAVKVASLSDEAKEAAREVGLDNNRSVLLTASKEEDPAKQVEVIKQKAERKSLKQQVADATLEARGAKASADDFNRQLQELRKELAKLRDANDTLRHELAYARSGTTAKPDDISQEHFDSMVKAMLAYREAMRVSSEKPSSLSPRSDEYRLSKDSVLKAQSALWNSFFPDDEEERA